MMSIQKNKPLDIVSMTRAYNKLSEMELNDDMKAIANSDMTEIRNHLFGSFLSSRNYISLEDAKTYTGLSIIQDSDDISNETVLKYELINFMAMIDRYRNDDDMKIISQSSGKTEKALTTLFGQGHGIAWIEEIRSDYGIGYIAPKGMSGDGNPVPDYDPKEKVEVKGKSQQQKQQTDARMKAEIRKKDTPASDRNAPPTMPKIQEATEPTATVKTATAEDPAQDKGQNDNLPTVLLPDSISDCTEIIPKKYILDGIIEAGSIVMIAGKEKIGKTYALKHMALCMASGRPWLGKATMQDEQGGVLWVNLDMKRDTARRRINEITNGLCESLHCPFAPEMFSKFFLIHSETFRKQGFDNLTFDGNAEKSVDEMERMIKDPRYNIKVCFIDSMIELEGELDENKAGDIGKFFRRIYQIRDATGCSFILIHHNTKSGDRGRGSSAIFGATELNLQLSQDSFNHDKLILTTDGARDNAEQEIGMLKVWKPRLNDDGTEMKDANGHTVWNFYLEWVDPQTISTTATEKNTRKEEAKNERYEKAVLKALENEPFGLSKNGIKDKARIDKQESNRAVDRLYDNNQIILLENGKYKLP